MIEDCLRARPTPNEQPPMKVTLDLDQLLAQGQISPEEYRRLASFAKHEQGSTAINLLIGFGTIAVAGGTLAMVASSQVATVLGLSLAIGGLMLGRARAHWELLGSILLVVGALMAAGGAVVWTEGSTKGFVLATLMFLVGSIGAQSRTLAALTALGILAAIGAGTIYEHASYGIAIEHPTITIGLFSLLGGAVYFVSGRISASLEPLAIVFARTCLMIVNFGFWIGSLWGDSLSTLPREYLSPDSRTIPAVAFAIAWALGLVAAGAWGIQREKRFVVNLSATFAAIHFYTQWFERLGAEPLSVIVAGLLAIAIALALFKYNQRPARPLATAPPQT
jgi:iron complex transport system permease protein